MAPPSASGCANVLVHSKTLVSAQELGNLVYSGLEKSRPSLAGLKARKWGGVDVQLRVEPLF